MGADLHLRRYHSQRRQKRHKCHSYQGQAILQLNRPFQEPRRGPRTGLRHPRSPAPLRQAPILRPPVRRSWTRLQKPRVSVLRCKPCQNLDIHDTSKHLPAGLTKYVLNSFSTKPPPFHVTLDVISTAGTPRRRSNLGTSTRSLPERHSRGHAGNPLGRTPQPFLRTRKQDLQHHRRHILRYWSETPSQHRQSNRLYRQMPIGALHRKLERSRGELFFAPGYSLVPRTLWLQRFSSTTPPAGVHLWYKAPNGLWWLCKVARRASTDISPANSCIVRFLGHLGPIKIDLLLPSCTASWIAVHRSWCLQRYRAGGLSHGVLRNADGPRRAPSISFSCIPACFLNRRLRV